MQHISNVAQDYRDGIFAGANNLVEVVTGMPALTVEEFVRANRSAFDDSGLAGRSGNTYSEADLERFAAPQTFTQTTT